MKEIFASFQKSLKRLEEILKKEKTVENRDAAIKRFEFTVELAWKCIQRFLREQGILCRSPRECLEEAFKFGLIRDNAVWLRAFEDRNAIVHTYDEKLADEIYDHFKDYEKLFKELANALKMREL